MDVMYSQCWEDPQLVRSALRVTERDDVLSIASGGDNTLALLLDDPRSVTALDYTPAQLHLVELKMAAMRQLPHDRFVAFLGVRPSENREGTFRQLIPNLSVCAADFWLKNLRAVRKGIIHCGRLERYFSVFRTILLPLIHSEDTVAAMLRAPTTQGQAEVYLHRWETQRWQLLFDVFFSRFVMERLGRRREYFRFAENAEVASTVRRRVQRGLCSVPICDNFYVQYILTGTYDDLSYAPPYLNPKTYPVIKSRLDRVTLEYGSLRPWLESRRTGSYSAFNLSDSLEYMAPAEAARTVQEISRVSREGGRIAYWTLFAERSSVFDGRVAGLVPLRVTDASTAARSFFYDTFGASCVEVSRGH